MPLASAVASNSPLPPALTLPLSGGDQGTVETIQHMCRLIDEGSKDPYVNGLAVGIVHGARVPQFDFEGECRALYRWFQRSVRFFRDIAGKETLCAARETLLHKAGDCDCQTVALGALLKTIGHNVRIVTISSHPQTPSLKMTVAEYLLVGVRAPENVRPLFLPA